jgi:hypothetical protein
VRRGLDEELVLIAPSPILTGLEALDDGMVRRVIVLRGVLVRRVVTAADVTARETEPQMHPAAVDLQAFLATFGCPRLDVANLIEMGAARSHVASRGRASYKVLSFTRVGIATSLDQSRCEMAGSRKQASDRKRSQV